MKKLYMIKNGTIHLDTQMKNRAENSLKTNKHIKFYRFKKIKEDGIKIQRIFEYFPNFHRTSCEFFQVHHRMTL